MATKAAPTGDQGGVPAGKQKPATSGENNRKPFTDIGNLVTSRGGCVEGKQQQQITRPVTRSFKAQQLANGQAVAVANKKSAAVLADGIVEKAAPKARKQKGTVRPKPTEIIEISPDTEEEIQKKPESRNNLRQESSRKKAQSTFTSLLTARSKLACGTAKILNIDEADSEDQLAVVDYVEDIYKFYRLAESSSRIPDYMHSQIEINDRMRAILVDWLIEVHTKFELMPETLYLTLQIIDHYLSMETVGRRELQLVGVSAMLIASKYEEIWAPEVNDFVCIADRAYTREQILIMEKKMLNKLEWSLTIPTQYVFLLRFLKAAGSDKEMEHMVFFLAELALINYSMIMYCPSMIAASAVYAANCTLQRSPLWSKTLKYHTGFSEAQLMDCAKLLVKFHSCATDSKLKVVYKKYLSAQRNAVALIPPAEQLKED